MKRILSSKRYLLILSPNASKPLINFLKKQKGKTLAIHANVEPMGFECIEIAIASINKDRDVHLITLQKEKA